MKQVQIEINQTGLGAGQIPAHLQTLADNLTPEAIALLADLSSRPKVSEKLLRNKTALKLFLK